MAPASFLTFLDGRDAAPEEPRVHHQSFVYSQGAHRATLTGGRTIDGNAECAIWDEHKDESIRPVPVYLTQGTQLAVLNLDIVRGAMWTVVPLECDDVVIDGLNINSTYGMNKDGAERDGLRVHLWLEGSGSGIPRANFDSRQTLPPAWAQADRRQPRTNVLYAEEHWNGIVQP